VAGANFAVENVNGSEVRRPPLLCSFALHFIEKRYKGKVRLTFFQIFLQLFSYIS
jgi:hypothetical protein